MQDLTGAMELALGKAVKEKYETDFFMLDKYPSTIRTVLHNAPMRKTSDTQTVTTFSFGVKRFVRVLNDVNDPDLLLEILKDKGIEAGDGLQIYIESFRHGVSPHAGAGIGLERVVFLYLGLDNVRKASMFPRDPQSMYTIRSRLT